MTKRRTFLCATLVLSALLLLLGMTSCSEPPHEHSYGAWDTVTAPTCTAFGIQKRACECGHVEYGTMAVLEHTPVTDAAVDATCATAGKTEGSHCEKCGTVIVKQNDVPTVAHSYSEWETVTAPTCTAFGLQKRACACGHVEYNTVAVLEHTPVTDAAVAATCTSAGKTEGSHCEKCGTVIVKQNDVPVAKHSYSGWESVTAPTCTAFGLQKRACACGHVEYNTVAVVGHTPVTDAAVAATCTTAGKTEGSHCSKCGAVIVKQNDVPVLAHSYSGWETVKAPTCTSIGLNQRACACGAVEYAATEALGHTAKTDAAVAANCTDAGKTEGSHCEKCGVTLVAQLTVAPLGHSFGDAAVITEATCALDGTKRYTCRNAGCGYSYDESFALPTVSGDAILKDAANYIGYVQSYSRFGDFLEKTTAFVIDSDGIIVTTYKGIKSAYYAEFLLNDVYYTVTDVLGVSLSNFAVLKVDATDLPCAPLCTNRPATGDTIYSVGAPVILPISLSAGTVSNAERSHNGITYLQHDADIEGYAGGPIFNAYGEVVAINVARIVDEEDTMLNVGAYVSDIETVDYSHPMTLEEWGNATYSALDQIARIVMLCYNYEDANTVAYKLEGRDFYYSIGVDMNADVIYVEGMWIIQGFTVNVRIYLNNTEGTYQYYATLTNGEFLNETIGYIDAATYDHNTALTYDSYYGKYWTESEVMALYTSYAYKVIGWLEFCLSSYTVDLSIADTLGFTAIEMIDIRDNNALGKIQDFIFSKGVYSEEFGDYRLFGNTTVGDNLIEAQLSYTPATDTTPAKTSIALFCLSPNGEQWSVQLNLDPTEYGYMFMVGYSTFYDGNFEFVNAGWGYLDPTTFTNLGGLCCYEFFGLNEYEDALLADYSRFVVYMIECLDTTLDAIDPSLTLKDLGFYFFED